MTEKNRQDPFGARAVLNTGDGSAVIYRLESLEKRGLGGISRLPFSIKVLLESVLRHCDGALITEQGVAALAGGNPVVKWVHLMHIISVVFVS